MVIGTLISVNIGRIERLDLTINQMQWWLLINVFVSDGNKFILGDKVNRKTLGSREHIQFYSDNLFPLNLLHRINSLQSEKNTLIKSLPLSDNIRSLLVASFAMLAEKNSKKSFSVTNKQTLPNSKSAGRMMPPNNASFETNSV